MPTLPVSGDGLAQQFCHQQPSLISFVMVLKNSHYRMLHQECNRQRVYCMQVMMPGTQCRSILFCSQTQSLKRLQQQAFMEPASAGRRKALVLQSWQHLEATYSQQHISCQLNVLMLKEGCHTMHTQVMMPSQHCRSILFCSQTQALKASSNRLQKDCVFEQSKSSCAAELARSRIKVTVS